MTEAAIQVMGRGEARQAPDANRALATGFGGYRWSDVVILGKEKPQCNRT